MHRMTRHLPVLGLLTGLATMAPRAIAAQETQTGDSTAQAQPGDTGEVQNPPGYRGMERPVNVFPPDSGSADSAGRVEDQATGTYDDSTWQDTSQSRQNPAGYRGMERPAGRDTAGTDTTGTNTAGPDSLRLSPTDSAGEGAATGAGTETGAAPAADDSVMAGRDSASVLPGDSASIQPAAPSRRLNPTDSAGGTQGP